MTSKVGHGSSANLKMEWLHQGAQSKYTPGILQIPQLFWRAVLEAGLLGP